MLVMRRPVCVSTRAADARGGGRPLIGALPPGQSSPLHTARAGRVPAASGGQDSTGPRAGPLVTFYLLGYLLAG